MRFIRALPNTWHTEHPVNHVYHNMHHWILCKPCVDCVEISDHLYTTWSLQTWHTEHLVTCAYHNVVYWPMCNTVLIVLSHLHCGISDLIFPLRLGIYWTHSDLCLPQCGTYKTICKHCVEYVVTLWFFLSQKNNSP